jgi:hypothetical protein
VTLSFGYNAGLPADRTVAWGARLIVTQGGDVDVVPDRLSAMGDDEPLARLFLHLNGLDPRLDERISRLLRDGKMQTRVAEELTVHADDVVIINANTNASHGYCYVVAYFAQAAAEAVQR